MDANHKSRDSLHRKLWLLVAIVLVFLSVVAQFIAGSLPSMVELRCAEGRLYSVGLYSVCTSNSSHTVWRPWHQDVTCYLMREHAELVPSWISGTHILAFSGVVASCLSLLLLCCYTRAPPCLSMSIADGLAALCFTPAALQLAGMLNLSSGINLPSSLVALLPQGHTCQRGQVRYAYGVMVIITAVILLIVAGVMCLLSKLMEDKNSAIAEYQQYLNDAIVTDMSDAYTREGGDGNVQGRDFMQRETRREVKEKAGDVTYRRRSTPSSISMRSGLKSSSLL